MVRFLETCPVFFATQVFLPVLFVLSILFSQTIAFPRRAYRGGGRLTLKWYFFLKNLLSLIQDDRIKNQIFSSLS